MLEQQLRTFNTSSLLGFRKTFVHPHPAIVHDGGDDGGDDDDAIHGDHGDAIFHAGNDVRDDDDILYIN